MKLQVSGASGSGVTTLGQALASRLGWTHFDADDYFWEPSDPPFTVKRNPDTRNRLISAALDRRAHWILGGSVLNWGDDVFPAFDLIIFLWVSPEVRMARQSAPVLEIREDITTQARLERVLSVIGYPIFAGL